MSREEQVMFFWPPQTSFPRHQEGKGRRDVYWLGSQLHGLGDCVQVMHTQRTWGMLLHAYFNTIWKTWAVSGEADGISHPSSSVGKGYAHSRNEGEKFLWVKPARAASPLPWVRHFQVRTCPVFLIHRGMTSSPNSIQGYGCSFGVLQ